MGNVVFRKIDTGRTHRVGGVDTLILDEAGEPETEWALCAIVDDHYVQLDSYSVGYVEHRVGLDHTAVDQGEGTPETAPANTDLDAANARIAELEAQLADAQAGTAQQTEQQPPPPAQ